ncbi:MAG: hypothetical protein E7657_06640 [Ruminococcaceae bacterium]|nr:hypothetical protein [Oscillospiraceae bacterium]
MVNAQKNYDFQKELLTVHEKNIRNFDRKPKADEFCVVDDAKILIASDAPEVISVAAEDFCDYLSVSMGVKASVVTEGKGDITVRLAKDVGVDLGEFAAYKGFRIETDKDGIVITAHDDRGAGQALYYIEDLMYFEHAPVLSYGKIEKRAMYTPQMVHSAYDIDDFPNEYLARIAHEGRDAVLLFTKGVGISARGEEDFNDLIRRAARYGIDVYAYSKLKSEKHPDDPDAEAYYDSTYGELFRRFPGLKGVTLVGESIGFPSKDPNSGPWNHPDGLPTGKTHPGFYPCYDYPEWVNCLKRSIRKYKPDADIVLWTYNFGWCSKEDRLKLLESLPTDITLNVTFEMFEFLPCGNSLIKSSDYSLGFAGPGAYFTSEAEVAKRRGIRLYSMTNTGGRTWDFGVAPYEPMPYQWMARYAAMSKAQKAYGLTGIMECHHFGLYPSIISKLSKHAFMLPEEPYEEILAKILKAEYGEENLETVDAALRDFSEAIKFYTATNSDQYGALRVGPAHPLNVVQSIKIPADPDSMFGNRIWYPKYLVNNNGHWMSTVSPLAIRIREEAKSFAKMQELMEKGIATLKQAPAPNGKLSRLLGLAQFITNSVKTAIAAKEMHLLDVELQFTPDINRQEEILNEMEALLRKERKNAEDTIPLVEADSALGYEPSMHYLCDKEHLEWKLRHTDYVLSIELSELRSAVEVHKAFIAQQK